MRMILRFILFIIITILLIFLIWFTVSNQQMVTFNLNGTTFLLDLVGISGSNELTLPAYIWALIIFGVGFIFGMIVTLLSGGKGRAKKRALKRELRATKKELTAREKEVEQVRAISDDIDPVALIKK